MGVEASDAGHAPEILRSAADNPRITQNMNGTCVKLNASKVNIPTAKLVTEAASAANNQPSSNWSGARDARKSRRTALTISQTHAPRPTKPTSRDVVQPLIVEDRSISIGLIEAGDPRPVALAEERLPAGLAQHRLDQTDTPARKQGVVIGFESRLLRDEAALGKERVLQSPDRAGQCEMDDGESGNESRPELLRLGRLEEQKDDHFDSEHHDGRARTTRQGSEEDQHCGEPPTAAQPSREVYGERKDENQRGAQSDGLFRRARPPEDCRRASRYGKAPSNAGTGARRGGGRKRCSAFDSSTTAKNSDHCPGYRDELEKQFHAATALNGRSRQVVDENETQEERHRLDDVRPVCAYPTRIRDLGGENTSHDQGERAVESRTPSRTRESTRSEAAQTSTQSATTTRYSSRLNGRLPGSRYRPIGTKRTTTRISAIKRSQPTVVERASATTATTASDRARTLTSRALRTPRESAARAPAPAINANWRCGYPEERTH